MALTTSDCAPEQEAELLRVHLAETHAAHTEIHSRQGTAFRLRFHYLSSLSACPCDAAGTRSLQLRPESCTRVRLPNFHELGAARDSLIIDETLQLH